MKKIMFVFGTRPEAIKMAPLVKAVEADDRLEPLVVVTAQHREMLDQVLELFDIHPAHDLNLMRPGQSLTDITAGVLRGIEDIIAQEKPDLVLVHGDTTTTFAGALAAFYQQVPIGHVEAGLRSGNLASPFPEEANRRLTGVMTTLHFAPTKSARDNLLRENVPAEAIFTTGNTVIDALERTVREDFSFADEALAERLQTDGPRILLTAHRRENLGAPMHHIFRAVRRLLDAHPQATVFFPIHKNPKVRAIAKEEFGDAPQMFFMEPLDYEPFVNLMNHVDLILTDSGGLQEEAPALGKPVLVLRDNTERPEAVEAGTVVLVGTEEDRIFDTAHRLLTDADAYRAMEQAVNPYGDGRASARIVSAIHHYFDPSLERIADWE